MLRSIYQLPVRYPKSVLSAILLLTVFALIAIQKGLHWETDARVYFPKDHPAIRYDERVADVFGVKDSVIIAIVNEKGIFNPETLARVARITEKVAALPGVIAQRKVDVASLASATVFVGTEDAVANIPLMETVPTTPEEVERVKAQVYAHDDLFVGNLVSPDGKATMIRIKLKEGIANRYQTYFQVKGILMGELQGGDGKSGGWQQWQGGAAGAGQSSQAGGSGAAAQGSQGQGNGNGQGGWDSSKSWGGGWDRELSESAASNGDRFYMAGRPVIEVTSGQLALADLSVMIPLLCLTIIVALFMIFRNVRGVVLPLSVVAIALIWTLGAMAATGYPLYTISTMLPVILVAVGIGNALHILSHYQDIVIRDAQRDRRAIVSDLMQELGAPLMVTTLTTMVGFLSLLWADMPPFRVFGVFTALGILFCWMASITLVPAALTLMQPHVSSYLARRRSLRLHSEAGPLARALVGMARGLMARRGTAAVVALLVAVVVGFGAQRLFVDSSWISDFKDGSEVVRSNDMLNEKFDGTIFLNVVIDGHKPDALKSPELLAKIDKLQNYVDGLQDVGGSISLIDYLKSTNETFHSGDKKFHVLPTSQREIAEYLFLLSVSGRPEQLDEVVDYDYRQANVTFAIKTDHTQRLKAIIADVNGFVDREFKGLDVDVNLAGSANNSYIWASLLIDSQISSILLSKIGILLMALLLFRSVAAGIYTILPVTFTTLLVSGAAGWLAIPLDVSTVLAAGLAIGVGVDFTVHYIFRYAWERRHGRDEHESVLCAMRSVGKPIVFNATVVAAGFLILGLSQFPPHVKLGYFVSAYMLVACLAALVLLPIAFAYYRPQFDRTTAPQREQPAEA